MSEKESVWKGKDMTATELLVLHKQYVLDPEKSGMTLEDLCELRGYLLQSFSSLFHVANEIAHGRYMFDPESRCITQILPDGLCLSEKDRLMGVMAFMDDVMKQHKPGLGAYPRFHTMVPLSRYEATDEDW